MFSVSVLVGSGKVRLSTSSVMRVRTLDGFLGLMSASTTWSRLNDVVSVVIVVSTTFFTPVLDESKSANVGFVSLSEMF